MEYENEKYTGAPRKSESISVTENLKNVFL